MGRQVTVSSISSITNSEDVCHFDELSEAAKDTLTRLLNDETTTGIESEAVNELAQYDVIKFTEYLTVCCDSSRANGPVSA
jgi:U3 small nucleolar RNA-associated protein 14